MGKSLHPVFYTLLFLILFVSAPTYAQERTGDLAVLDVRAGTKLPAEINLALLSQIVREEAVKATSYRVMTKENIFAILQDKGIDTSKCADVECEVQYGRVLQADKLVVGEVNLVGSTYYLSLNLYDTPSAAIDKSITKECERCTFRQLVAQVREAAKGLFGVAVGREAPGAEQKWEAEEVEAETVQFESEPPGATVEIGKKPACETPCSQRLQAGVYRVAMRKPRYLPYEERVTVKKGMDPVAARLEPTFGWLTITSEPAGAEIVINGKKVGATPIQDMETDPGNYEIVAHSAGHIDARKKIVLARGKRQEIALTLQLVKAEPSLGWLTVKSTPSGFSVFVDGNVVGSTPVEEMEVSPGEHEVAVRGARYYEAKKKVVIEKGKRQTMALKLEPREGEIKVRAVDEKGNAVEGEVSLDGSEVGKAPGTFTVMIGEHEVEVKGPGGTRWRGTVNVEEKQTRSVEAKFRTREEQAITGEMPSAIEKKNYRAFCLSTL